jgi:plastocyanin
MKKLIGFPGRLTGIIFLSAVFMISNNCSKQSDEVNGGNGNEAPYWNRNQVSVVGDQFDPRELTVVRNDSVTWVNNTSNVYRIICDSGHFTGTIRPGESFIHVFTNTGTFEYRGNYPEMKGSVIVH